MTTHNEKAGILFECDGCNEQLDTLSKDWDNALALLKNDGWKAEKISNEWMHLCPRCRRPFK